MVVNHAVQHSEDANERGEGQTQRVLGVERAMGEVS